MKRSELEHLIRAAGAVTGDSAIVIIGSQAILGQYPDAPTSLLTSMEADLYPRNAPARADDIEGAMGEGSRFHESHGYYAQAVGEETATLPAGWKSRLITIRNINTNGIAGLCLEVHDLAISKYVAGRPKDREFTAELARHGLTSRALLADRLAATPVGSGLRQLVGARISADFGHASHGQ